MHTLIIVEVIQTSMLQQQKLLQQKVEADPATGSDVWMMSFPISLTLTKSSQTTVMSAESGMGSKPPENHKW